MANSNNSGMFSYQEFTNRGVIKLAPDALVYIGGSLQMQVLAPVAGKSSGSLSFNDGITAISVQNNVDPPGTSTASIEVVTPVYGERSNYWTTYPTDAGLNVRLPVFIPMMEIKIFFKGRFMVNGQPRYYPAFWGFISGVEENYSGGVHKISLQCVDILHWWAYSTITTHPVPASGQIAGGGMTQTVFSTIFETANPFSIIWRLFQEMGMNDFVAPTWLAQMTSQNAIYPTDQFRKAATGIMAYWGTRFKNLGSLLKMYGLGGETLSIDKDGHTIATILPDPSASRTINEGSPNQAGTQVHNITNFSKNTEWLTRFTPFFEYEKMGKFDQAETKTKLEIATELKTRTDYEFYQDTNGNFIFKPPFYNIDTRGIPSYEIDPHDIINCSFNTDTEGIVTVLQVHTAMAEAMYNTSFGRGEGFHMDLDLTMRYGLRYQEMNVQYIADPNMARQVAVAQMALINSKALTGTVSMPGRPEMRLGYPVYFKHRDSFHYVKSISHSFDYGGSFTTSLSLELERRKMFDWGDPYHPEGKVLNNMMYKYTGDVAPNLVNPDSINLYPTVMGASGRDEAGQKKLALQKSQTRVAGMQEGRYQLMDAGDSTSNWSITDKTVPFTDEFGYRVIGSYPYGRGLDPLNIEDIRHIYSYKYSATLINSASMRESIQMQNVFVKGKGMEMAVPQYLTDFDIIGGLVNEVSITAASDQATQSGPDVQPSIDHTMPNATTTPSQMVTFIKPEDISGAYGVPSDLIGDVSLAGYTPPGTHPEYSAEAAQASTEFSRLQQMAPSSLTMETTVPAPTPVEQVATTSPPIEDSDQALAAAQSMQTISHDSITSTPADSGDLGNLEQSFISVQNRYATNDPPVDPNSPNNSVRINGATLSATMTSSSVMLRLMASAVAAQSRNLNPNEGLMAQHERSQKFATDALALYNKYAKG